MKKSFTKNLKNKFIDLLYPSRKKRKRKIIAVLIILSLVIFSSIAFLLNPFNERTIFKNPHSTSFNGKEIVLVREYPLQTNQTIPYRLFAYFKSGIHILFSSFREEKDTGYKEINDIFKEIQRQRFSPEENPYLISGGHFSVLYPRNFGVFYHPTMDPFIPLSESAWIDRERTHLQAISFAVDALSSCGNVFTTIVPTGRKTITCINIYHYPSDTMYGLLFGIDRMISYDEIRNIYYENFQDNSVQPFPNHTATAVQNLLSTKEADLKKLISKYLATVQDPQSGLIKREIHISSAKDVIKRESAFYDNVILWKTLSLAKKLNLHSITDQELAELKQKIITTYWRDDPGIFIEDLSTESMQNHYYSSDWLAVLYTSFLDPYDETERYYYQKIIEYIQQNNLDKPIPIKYQAHSNDQRNVGLVHLVAKSYAADSIWQFWGTEYVKLLYLMYDATGEINYKDSADYFTHIMQFKIEETGGFPEIYDNTGDIFEVPFYRSVINTGWFVNFEQVLKLKELTDSQYQ